MNRFLLYFCLLISSFATAKEKTICLNMIVKNESRVIQRCLDSVMDKIDSWVIVDTGSSDGTQKLIRDLLKHKPGALYERPWVNFGHNRQEALELAKGKGDYILFMDADDTLAFDEGFKWPDLVSDFYLIKTKHAQASNSEEFFLPQLVKGSIAWHWNGVLHEYINAVEDTHGSMLEGVARIYYHDGCRGNDPNTIHRDIALLKEGLKAEPKNGHYMFYLGYCYTVVNDWENAIQCYRKVAALDAKPSEVFWSKLRLGKLLEVAEAPLKEIETAYLDAYQYSSERMEPLYYLANLARTRGNYQKGYDIARRAILVPFQEDGITEDWIYHYGLPFECAASACELGHVEKSLEICNRLLERSDLPIEWRQNIGQCKLKALELMKEDVLKVITK